ncbi:MAG: glycoside hydrolase family 31 protein, partial [Chitinophagaceae bacterium]|nr:glycoside hydrolase family 31 protein [Chitinophagaceae bacterium]
AGKKIELPAYFESAGFRGFTFRLKKNEEIYGTGERSVPLNRRGYKLNLYNQPAYGYSMNAESLNYSVPFIISSDGYGIFFDNPSKSYLDIGKTNNDIMQYGASSGELTFYRIPGKNMDEILRKYQSLVGTQPIPARWVFGNLMSRFGYRSEAQLMSTVNKMKAENFPVDAVILDLFWFGDSIQGTLGNLDWKNKTAWPEPKKMIANLNQQGIKTILITEPFVLNTTPNYEVSKKFQAVDSAGDPFVLTTFYFGNGGLLDLFRKDAQDWFWSKYEPQIANGVTGWWGDLGEPETHPSTMNHNLKDLGFNRIFKADEVHNIYGHYWDKMLFDKYAKEYPSVRIFNLNRSGYAGSPRYGVFPWSGDVSRSWDGLKAQLPLMIGMSMSGVPYIHADAGGFAGGDGDKELYTRWLQFATFTPVFRPHGTALGNMDPNAKDIPSEAALYDDPYKSIVRRYMQLRYAMLPYNYTMAYQQAKFGKPLVRPLFYYGSSDSNLLKAGDEFMWGDEILVAPVLEKGVAERKIYFPEGNWYNLITDEKITGHKWGSEKTDINNIPVFVKEGSFVPLFISSDPVKNTGDYTGKDLTVKYYLSAQTSAYTMFDDDGITNNTLGKGNYELINFTGRAGTKKITVKISGSHKIIQATRNIKFLFPADSKIIAAMINNKPVLKNKTGSVMNEFKNREDLIEFQYSGKPLDIVITLQ